MTDPTAGDAKVAALRQEIEETRAELGETVEALAAKADVKARAQDKVDETKARVNEVVAEAKDKARVKAQQVAGSGKDLARDFKADPAEQSKRAAYQVRTSVQQRPRHWATAAGAVVVTVLLIVVRRRRAKRAQWGEL